MCKCGNVVVPWCPAPLQSSGDPRRPKTFTGAQRIVCRHAMAAPSVAAPCHMESHPHALAYAAC